MTIMLVCWRVEARAGGGSLIKLIVSNKPRLKSRGINKVTPSKQNHSIIFRLRAYLHPHYIKKYHVTIIRFSTQSRHICLHISCDKDII